MSDDGVGLREEVRRLRRADHRRFVALLAALLVATAGCVVFRRTEGVVFGGLLALLCAACVSATKHSRGRDERVLGMDDEAVRDYLRGRLDGLIARTKKLMLPALLGVPVALLGLLLVAVEAFVDGGPPRPDLAAFGVAFAAMGSVLAGLLWTRFVTRRALIRRRGELGDAPATTPAWIVEMARDIAAKESVSYAALFWHEATGVRVRDAGRAVRNLPDPPGAPPPSGPPDEVLRARVRKLARGDLIGHAVSVALFVGILAADVRAIGRTSDEFLREGPATFAQGAWLGFAALFLAGGLVAHALHRKALAGGASSLRAYYVRELDKRIARLVGWKAAAIARALAGTLFLAAAAGAAGGQLARGGPVAAAPWLVEALLVFAWLVALPWWNRRRALPALERRREELRASDAASGAAAGGAGTLSS